MKDNPPPKEIIIDKNLPIENVEEDILLEGKSQQVYTTNISMNCYGEKIWKILKTLSQKPKMTNLLFRQKFELTDVQIISKEIKLLVNQNEIPSEHKPFSTKYNLDDFFIKFLECLLDLEAKFINIHQNYKTRLDKDFTKCFQILLKLNANNDFTKTPFHLCQQLFLEKKYNEFYFFSTHLLSIFFNPSIVAFSYLKIFKDDIIIEIKIPEIMKECIKTLINYNCEPFRKIITGINPKIHEEQIQKLIQSVFYANIFFLPDYFPEAGLTDYSGRIYITSQCNNTFQNLTNKSYEDLDEYDFYLLAILIHEFAHWLKIAATKTINNVEDPLAKSPRDCLLYEDEDRKIELYPEAGCYVEVEMFGSIIESAEHLESSDHSNTAAQNAKILFEKIRKKEKIMLETMKNLKVRISLNKHFAHHHPFEIRHIAAVH